MQSTSSRIWTRVAVSISYDDNHSTTGTSCIYICICIHSYIYVYAFTETMLSPLVGGSWEQGIARVFTHCMMKYIYIYIYRYIYIYIRMFPILFYATFSHLLWLVGFHWSSSDSKFSRFYWSFLSIIADFNRAILGMVPVPHLIFNSARPFFPGLLGLFKWPRDFVLYILPLGLVWQRTFGFSTWVS